MTRRSWWSAPVGRARAGLARIPVARIRLMPLTLRGRLLVGILTLVTLGLAGTDVAAYRWLSGALDARSDRQLDRTVIALERALTQPSALMFADGVMRNASPGTADAAFIASDGGVVATLPPTVSSPSDAAFVATTQEPSVINRLMRRPDHPIRLDLAGVPYRMLYHPVQPPGPGAGLDDPLADRHTAGVVVAFSFSSDQDTLDKLATSEITVTAVALLVLALLAIVFLRLGLRPLASMAATATAIAEGDTGRRVPVDEPHTEVGQLALALNRAFDERSHAEDRLRRFLADVSHELRTPLTSIRGWADLYFQGGLPEPDGVETALTRIAEDAGQVSRLVEELLLLARLDQHRQLAAEPVDLTGLAAEVVEDARVVDPARPIMYHAGPGPYVVTGDADRLRQVVRNLVGNAVQHTPTGTPVAVGLSATATPQGPAVLLTVTDEGPGISAADQEHIFERFFRTDPSRNHHHGGAGLGLAIVRAIVQAHHGQVDLDSAPGMGTRFRVTLPATADAPATGQIVSQPSG